MRRITLTTLVLLLLVEIYSLLPARPGPETLTPKSPQYQWVRGAIHVKSRYSLPSGESPEQIVEAARSAGLRFVVLADEDSVEARREGLAGDHGGVDLYVEVESTTPAGDLVLFHSHTGAAQLSAEALKNVAWQHFLGQNTYPGIFATIAHPSHIDRPWSRLDRYVDGIEVVNFDAQWRRQQFNSLFSFGTTLALVPFNPFLAALRFLPPHGKDLEAWDAMNALSSGHFGYIAHDTLSRLTLLGDWHFRSPRFSRTFRVATNLVQVPVPLPEDFAQRRQVLYRAIRGGRLVMAFPLLYPPEGADWRVSCPQGREYRTGDEFALLPSCRFHIALPEGFPFRAYYRLVRDSVVASEGGLEKEITLPVKEPGSYRLEIWAETHTLLRMLLNERVPYLLYNPIYIR